jgi:hypothetical protein
MAAVAERVSAGGSWVGRPVVVLLNMPPSSKKVVSSPGRVCRSASRSAPREMIGMAVVADVEEVSSRGCVLSMSGAGRAPVSCMPGPGAGPGPCPHAPGPSGGAPPNAGGIAGDEGGP